MQNTENARNILPTFIHKFGFSDPNWNLHSCFFFILEQSLTSGQLYLFILKSDTVWSWPVLSFGLPVSDSSMAAYQQFLKYIY